MSDWGSSNETIYVAATPGADDSGVPQSVRGGAAGKKEADAERAANRLRKAGYSYRRIAETLKIPYITVSRWLSGDVGVVHKPPPPPPSPLRVKVDPRDLVPADKAADGTPAPARPSPPSPERGAEDDTADLAHRVEVLGLQFSAFEGYARDMAEEFNQSRKELLDSQAKAVEDMARERDSIVLARKGFETAIQRFDNKFDELAAELRGELETLKSSVAEQLAALRKEMQGLAAGGAAPKKAAAADPFADDAEDDDDNPFGGGGKKAADPDDPFASDDDDPFGSGGDDDPFASGGDDDPFATGDDDDPFAAPKKKADPDDPFASGDDDDDPFGAGGDDDPFAAGDDDDPFAAPKKKADPDDPFADVKASDNPFGSDDDDPFGGDNPFGSDDNPFGDDASKKRELT